MPYEDIGQAVGGAGHETVAMGRLRHAGDNG